MKPENNDMILDCCYQSPVSEQHPGDVHFDESVEIIQFLSTGGYMISGENVFPILSGSVMLLSKFSSHSIKTDDAISYNRSKLVISARAFHMIMELCGFSKEWEEAFFETGAHCFRFSPSSSTAISLDKIFRKAAKYFYDEENPMCRQPAVMECVIQILSIAFCAEEQDALTSRQERAPLSNQMAEYINARLTAWDTISLEDICTTLHISPSYASHLFKKLTNKSITQYTTDLRIAEAKKLLLTTDMKIYEIAEQLQFHNTTIFCKTFRKCVQCTPKHFRDSGGEPTEE